MTLRLVLTDGNGIQGLAATFGAYINTSISDAAQYAAQAQASATSAGNSATAASGSASAAATSATQAANSATAAATSATNASNSASAASGSASAASTSATNAANSATAAAGSATNAATSATNAANSATAAATSASNAAATLANAVLVDGSRAMTGNLARSGLATDYRAFAYKTSGSSRWDHGATGQGETGGNAGSNWALQRYNDAGVAIDTPLTVIRSTGQLTTTVRPTFNGNTPWDTGNFNPSNYLPLTGGTLTGALTVGGPFTANLGANTATLAVYSDTASEVVMEAVQTGASATKYTLNLAKYGGGVKMGSALNMGGNAITNGADPTNAQDFATKNYADKVDRPSSMLLNPYGSISMDNTGLTAIASAPSAPYFCEQWRSESGGSSLAAQSGVGSSGVNGAPQVSKYNPYHMYTRTTTAKASLAAGDYAFMHQPVEGIIAPGRMQYGLTSARYSWLVFRAAATQAATMSVSVRNGAGSRSFVSTVALTTTPTDYAIGIPGDTAGSWVWTTAPGAVVGFCLAAGTTFQTSTLNAWQNGNFLAANTQSNMLDTLNRGFYVSDVGWYDMVLQPSFMPVDLAMEYLRCQRYFAKTYNQSDNPGTATSTGCIASVNYAAAAGGVFVTWKLPVEMRATPTVTAYNATSGTSGTWRSGNSTDCTASSFAPGTSNVSFQISSVPTINLINGHAIANARM